jgi:urea transport system substrate-binding protein
MISIPSFKPLLLGAGVALGLSASLSGFAEDSATAAAPSDDETIKVGVLHSLSGTMAISETTLKDTVLMLIEEQNEKGGVLGKKLEDVVVDPASDWPLFAEKAITGMSSAEMPWLPSSL